MEVKIGPYLEPNDDGERDINIKIDKWDTWSMDHTLALIIHPMLIQLKETKMGSAIVEDEDVPQEFWNDHLDDDSDEKDNLIHKKWDWVLDEMIWAFGEELNDNWEEQYQSGEWDMVSVPVDKDMNPCDKKDAKFYQMVDGPNHTFKMDREGLKAHADRMERGFRLFGKYYRGLWD